MYCLCSRCLLTNPQNCSERSSQVTLDVWGAKAHNQTLTPNCTMVPEWSTNWASTPGGIGHLVYICKSTNNGSTSAQELLWGGAHFCTVALILFAKISFPNP